MKHTIYNSFFTLLGGALVLLFFIVVPRAQQPHITVDYDTAEEDVFVKEGTVLIQPIEVFSSQKEKTDIDLILEVMDLLDKTYLEVPDEFLSDEIRENKKGNEQKTERDFIFNAIRGLILTTGDPHTSFLSSDDYKNFTNVVLEGQISGIGILVDTKEGQVVIVSPLKGTPAEAAGLASGDVILKVDEYEIPLASDVSDVSEKIRGKRGTPVDITYFRPSTGRTKEVSIVRDVISIPEIVTHVIYDDIFVIAVHGFSKQTLVEFGNALETYLKGNYKHLILDVRGNPGGVLGVVIRMAALFVPEGEAILYEYDGNPVLKKYRVQNVDPLDAIRESNTVILVDGGSASASEVLAGALQVYNKATVVGTPTFGKGSVQELIPLSDGSRLKVTKAYWLLPNKKSINGVGVPLDIEVDREDIEAYANALERSKEQSKGYFDIDIKDPYIKAAVSFLKNK